MSHPAPFSDTQDHDDGLLHAHDWASGYQAASFDAPRVHDAGSVATPSSARHDDAFYA